MEPRSLAGTGAASEGRGWIEQEGLYDLACLGEELS